MWDNDASVSYINSHAEPSSLGKCAAYVRRAVEAGGVKIRIPPPRIGNAASACDYGPSFESVGFKPVYVYTGTGLTDTAIIPGQQIGDVVVIQPIEGHPHGHIALFNGTNWVSDFVQFRGFYPGQQYRNVKPAYTLYRYIDVSENEGAGSTRSTDSKRICFPARKADGKDYTTLEEMMGLIGREPHGSWLAGTNHLWHGGIHIGTVSAPGSILTTDTSETAVPLQCMVNGEVVAWRLNKDYRTAAYGDKTLRYSSTFVLVKSVFKPDAKKENSWLEFYSLYMGLAPLSAFPKGKCFKAKTMVSQRKAGKFENSASSDGVPTAPAKFGQLKKDQRVIVLQEKQFRNGDQVQPFGLAKKLNGKGYAEGEAFWVTVMPEYMEPDGEQYLQMPVWMQKAVDNGEFDKVVKPPTTLAMEAGEAIGFLGEDITPAGKGNVDCCHYAHIEVISMDPRMPNFLNNPAEVTTGQKYIQILSGKSLYQKMGEGPESTFKAMSCIVLKDGGKILPRDKCNPLVDKAGTTWFEVSPHSWMCQDDVKEIHQYDLKERGFSTLEEAPSPDVSKSLRESWVKGAYNWLSERVGKERGIQQKQVSAFYKSMIKKIDADGDGELSGKELYNALHHPELGLRDIAARLVVKHDSEWFGGSNHHRWSVFFQNYDRLRIAYAKQWIDDCEWMSKVPPFSKGEPIWHFHPVMFLESLKNMHGYWELGKTSEHYESGGRGPGVISSGRGDHGGASYGKYQFSSNMGVVQPYVQQSKFKVSFEGLAPATPEFNKVWRKIAESHTDEFSKEQHAYIKKTHYEVQLDYLKSKGVVFSAEHAAINDMIWSTSVQYGPKTGVIVRALKGKDVGSLSEKDIITIVQDYKYTNVENLFPSSPTWWDDLKTRAVTEKRDLLKLESLNKVIKNED